MTAYLNAVGVICALGRGPDEVARNLFAGDCTGMQRENGWVPERSLTVGAVHDTLPVIPPELRQQSSRNNQLLLDAALQIHSQIQQAISTYGPARVAIVLGTSTSGIDEARVWPWEYWDSCSIPGLAQWIKKLALSSCGIDRDCSSDQI